MPRIRLPNGWQPRPYQRKLWDYLENGGKRAIAIWHRRAGKDEVFLHRTAVATHERVGTYWYMLPEAAQARKAIWEAVNPHTGRRRIDEAFPRGLREATRENEMFIRFRNGSTWQVVGSDNYNSLVGSPPVGVVFSEFALSDPNAWGYIQPILLENGGWAAFNSTPRGRNHLHALYELARNDPDWFAEVLAASDTGLFDDGQLEKTRKEMCAFYGPDDGDGRFRQEYLCSFAGGMLGAYYARMMEDAEAGGRVANVPHDPRLSVHTSWDLGKNDANSIWCWQLVASEVRAINYLENSGVGPDWYIRELTKLPYTWGEHILPHDAGVEEYTSDRTREAVIQSLGFRNTRVLPRSSIQDGINAVRMILPRMWFDREKTARGRECLINYRREWDDKRRCYSDRPYHDWSSNGADSARYFAVADVRNAGPSKPLKYPNMQYA